MEKVGLNGKSDLNSFVGQCQQVVGIGDHLVPGTMGIPESLRYNTEQRIMCQQKDCGWQSGNTGSS